MNRKYYSRKMSIISLTLSLLLGLIAVGMTVSWYVTNRIASIKTDDNIVIKSRYPGLKIGINDGSLVSGRQTYSPTETASLFDITGDGIDFLYPKYLDLNDNAPNDPTGYAVVNSETSDKDVYFIEFKITFSTIEAVDVYLNNSSYVYPASLQKNGNEYVRDAQTGDLKWIGDLEEIPEDADPNPSIYNSALSNDWIASCVRVAFIEVDEEGNESLLNLWIPNDKWELKKVKTKDENNNEVEKYVIDQRGSRESRYGYISIDENNNVVNNTYDKFDYANGIVTVGNDNLASFENEKFNNGKCLVSFDGEVGSPTEKSIVVRIWFEGTDREASTVLNNGNIVYNFEFGAMKRKNESSSNVDFVYYDETTGKLTIDKCGDDAVAHGDYSADGKEVVSNGYIYTLNGIDWIAYDGKDLRTSSIIEEETVYYHPSFLAIKLAETDDTASSQAKLLIGNN